MENRFDTWNLENTERPLQMEKGGRGGGYVRGLIKVEAGGEMKEFVGLCPKMFQI